jgi:hypothetical protein
MPDAPLVSALGALEAAPSSGGDQREAAFSCARCTPVHHGPKQDADEFRRTTSTRSCEPPSAG